MPDVQASNYVYAYVCDQNAYEIPQSDVTFSNSHSLYVPSALSGGD